MRHIKSCWIVRFLFLGRVHLNRTSLKGGIKEHPTLPISKYLHSAVGVWAWVWRDVLATESDWWKKQFCVCTGALVSSDLLAPSGSLLPSPCSLSFSLTCPEALVVSLLTHCSSAHIHINTHTPSGKRGGRRRGGGGGRGGEEGITFKVCWRRVFRL